MSDTGFLTSLTMHEYSLENYIGEVYIRKDRLYNAIRVSLGKKKIKDVGLMYYYGDRGNIPQRLKEMFGYE